MPWVGSKVFRMGCNAPISWCWHVIAATSQLTSKKHFFCTKFRTFLYFPCSNSVFLRTVTKWRIWRFPWRISVKSDGSRDGNPSKVTDVRHGNDGFDGRVSILLIALDNANRFEGERQKHSGHLLQSKDQCRLTRFLQDCGLRAFLGGLQFWRFGRTPFCAYR